LVCSAFAFFVAVSAALAFLFAVPVPLVAWSAADFGCNAIDGPSRCRFDVTSCSAFRIADAFMNAVGAPSGTGAALLPLRNWGFLIGFGRSSQIDGNSGEDEMMTTESWYAIREGEEESRPVAILGLSSREK
jgi:hypothetical protein